MGPPWATPETAWTFSGIDAETVVVADGAALVGGRSAVAALSLSDGTLEWTAETEGSRSVTATVCCTAPGGPRSLQSTATASGCGRSRRRPGGSISW
jgi:outer membrane protein assembly factor BamB